VEIKIEKDFVIRIPQEVMEQTGLNDETSICFECLDDDKLTIKKL